MTEKKSDELFLITVGTMSLCANFTFGQWWIYFNCQTWFFFLALVWYPYFRDKWRSRKHKAQSKMFSDIYGQFGSCVDTHEAGSRKPFFEGSVFHDSGWHSTHIISPDRGKEGGTYQGKVRG